MVGKRKATIFYKKAAFYGAKNLTVSNFYAAHNNLYHFILSEISGVPFYKR